MADIFNDPSMGVSSVTKITNNISQNGVTGYLTMTYKVDDEKTTSFYSGIGSPVDNNDIPIGFGRVMLTGLLVVDGVVRADLDPTQIKKVLQFVTTEGPTKGIVGVDAGKLQSIYVGGKQVSTTTTQNQNIGVKEILGGIAASTAIMAGVSYIKDMLNPVSDLGTPIPDSIKSLIGDSKSIALSDVKGVDVTAAKDWDIMRYDASKKKFIADSFVTVHKKSGIEVDDFVTKKDGVEIRSDTMCFNFIGTGVTVTDVGGDGKQVNITINAGTGGGGTDPGGGGTDPTTPTTCKKSVAVTCDPRKGSRFLLKRNSKIVGLLLIDQTNSTSFTTRAQVATYLATKTVIPTNLTTTRFAVAASSNLINITGDATCKPCDLGDWALECFSPAPPASPPGTPPQNGGSSTPVDPCAPQKPTLTTA